MSEDLIELVDRATHDAPWDADRLVAGAVTTGRSRLRRRRAAAALVTCAALGVTGTGLLLTGQGSDDATHGVDPAARQHASASPTPTPTPTPDASPDRWRLAVTSRQVPDTFGALVPGTITTLPQKEYLDGSPIVDFQWDGYAVQVGVTPDDYVDGSRVTDPLTRCRQQGSADQACVTGRTPGSYEQTMTWTGPAGDGGVTTRFVTVYFAEGWDVSVMEANGPDFKESAPTSDQLPLTLDQLRDVAYSRVWFE